MPGMSRVLQSTVCVFVLCIRVSSKGSSGGPVHKVVASGPSCLSVCPVCPNLHQAPMVTWGGTKSSMHPIVPTLHIPSQVFWTYQPPTCTYSWPQGWHPLGESHHSPLHVHSSEGEGHPFEQQHHEEPLAEGAVPHALSILACLWAQKESSAALAPWHGPSGGSPRGYRVNMIEYMPQAQPGKLCCSPWHLLCQAGCQVLAPACSLSLSATPQSSHIAQQVLALARSGNKDLQADPASQCQGHNGLRTVVAAGVAVAGAVQQQRCARGRWQ